jgi:hypothetical protein
LSSLCFSARKTFERDNEENSRPYVPTLPLSCSASRGLLIFCLCVSSSAPSRFECVATRLESCVPLLVSFSCPSCPVCVTRMLSVTRQRKLYTFACTVCSCGVLYMPCQSRAARLTYVFPLALSYDPRSHLVSTAARPSLSPHSLALVLYMSHSPYPVVSPATLAQALSLCRRPVRVLSRATFSLWLASPSLLVPPGSGSRTENR